MNKNFDGHELISVARLDYGGGYDWDELEVYYVESERRFFWLSGSGCSCDGLWIAVMTLSEMENGNRKDAVNAIRSYARAKNESSGWGLKEGAEAVAEVMSFKIPK